MEKRKMGGANLAIEKKKAKKRWGKAKDRGIY